MQQRQPNAPGLGMGQASESLSAKKYKEMLLAHGMQPDDADESSSMSNNFMSKGADGGKSPQNSAR